jgi:hypothetical protein
MSGMTCFNAGNFPHVKKGEFGGKLQGEMIPVGMFTISNVQDGVKIFQIVYVTIQEEIRTYYWIFLDSYQKK